MRSNCVYFVEGKCEETLLSALKESPAKIRPGKVRQYNVVSHLIPNSVLIAIQPGTTVVFVFDTDVEITEYLKKNIEMVKRYCVKAEVIFLPQVLNLEQELVRCTDANAVTELTHSKTVRDFKRDFCSLTNCRDVLTRHRLDVRKLWTTTPPEPFRFVPANSSKIKI